MKRDGDGAAVRGATKSFPPGVAYSLVQHGVVLSEVRFHPGPTHSVADVIAAVLQALEIGPRFAMLGFAGGGTIGPLRAMAGGQVVDAVDMDTSGCRLFRRYCASWAGEVHFKRAEACAWLRLNRHRYDAVIEDLSIPRDSDVFKPAATWSELPPLIYRNLRPGGVAIFNLLRPTEVLWEGSTICGSRPGTVKRAGRRCPGAQAAHSAAPPSGSWGNGMRRVVRDGWESRVVYFTDYENRLLIVGRSLPSASHLSRRVRWHLKSIRSRLAARIAVRQG